jgi:hypothetical protein
MVIPHHTETMRLNHPLEMVSQRLIENLHLRWYYGVTHFEEYADEAERTVYVVHGVVALSVTRMLVFIVWLNSVDADTTAVTVECGQPNTGGYPLNFLPDLQTRWQPRQDNETCKVAKDILNFCHVPHGEGASISDRLRRVFENIASMTGYKTRRTSKRKE